VWFCFCQAPAIKRKPHIELNKCSNKHGISSDLNR
jgi:hypothetical protein